MFNVIFVEFGIAAQIHVGRKGGNLPSLLLIRPSHQHGGGSGQGGVADNFHPGSHTGLGAEKGIELIADMLNEVMNPDQSTTVLLETMAGKGSEIGGSFEEIAAIIDRVVLKNKIGVCLDTCHVSDAGYEIKDDLDRVIEDFDEIIGLEKLKALHINDSLNPAGAHKDRHAKIGEGWLGLEAIRKVVHDPRLEDLPCILETPQEDLSGYAREIKLLR